MVDAEDCMCVRACVCDQEHPKHANQQVLGTTYAAFRKVIASALDHDTLRKEK